MNIACLSGKGGAGKTFVAVSLAAAAKQATYIDCDVEEPNGWLFLKPQNTEHLPVSVPLPSFDKEKCTGCRKCVSFCRFHALLYIKEAPMVFPEVCHSCGGCSLVCPEGAVSYQPKPIGSLEIGTSGSLRIVTGELNPGEASGIPVIREALKRAQGLTIIDCPPGSACSVMESVMASDYCLLIAEPTAFGFHNFRMVHQLATLLNKPCGVVINKEDSPFSPLEQYCRDQHLPIHARIPYNAKIAASAAAGTLVIHQDPDLKDLFVHLLDEIGGGV